MKFKFDVPELQKRLGQLSSVVARKAQEPLYGNVRIAADAAGAVSILGIDIDATLALKLIAASADGPGSVLLEYKKLNEVVQNIRSKEAYISIVDEKSAAIITSKFKGTMVGTPTERFNELPVVLSIADQPDKDIMPGYTLGLPGLQEQIEQVIFAVPLPDGKFVVPSILLESTQDKLSLVASDGHVLVVSSQAADLPAAFAFTLPKPLLEIIQKLNGGTTVNIIDTENGFYISTEIESLTYAKTHSEFPPYEKVIPRAGVNLSTALLKDKEEIIQAARTCKPFANADEPGVKFVFEGRDNQSFIDLDVQHASEQSSGDVFTTTASAQVDADISGPKSTFKLNLSRLQPFLERALFPITMYALDHSHPIDIHANGGTPEKPTYRLVIMPMRYETV